MRDRQRLEDHERDRDGAPSSRPHTRVDRDDSLLDMQQSAGNQATLTRERERESEPAGPGAVELVQRTGDETLVADRPADGGGSTGGSDTEFERFDLETLEPGAFARWIDHLIGVKGDTGVGSLAVSVRFDVYAGGGIPNLVSATGGLFVTLSATMNVADDRRFRVAGTLGVGATVGVSALANLIKMGGEGSIKLGLGAAFPSTEHFSQSLFAQIGSLLRPIIKGIQKKSNQERHPLSEKEVAKLNKLHKIAKGSGVIIKAQSGEIEGKAMASVGGDLPVGAEAETVASAKYTNFFKKMGNQKYWKQGNTLLASARLKASAFGFGVEVAAKTTRVRNDANPNNDGNYLNVKLTPSVPLPVDPALLAAIAQDVPTKVLKDPKELVAAIFKTAPAATIAELAGGALEGGFSIEWNFTRDPSGEDNWALQYSRMSAALSKKVELQQEGTPYPGVVVGAKESLSVERSSGLLEVLGSTTLTYVRTVYDGLMNRGEALGAKQWGSWSDSHQSELVKACAGIARCDTPAPTEVESSSLPAAATLAKACKRALGKPERAEKALADPGPTWDRLRDRFDAYLAANRQADKEKAKDTWTQLTWPTVTAEATVVAGSLQSVTINKIDKDYLKLNGGLRSTDAGMIDTLEKALTYRCRVRLKVRGAKKTLLELDMRGAGKTIEGELAAAVAKKYPKRTQVPRALVGSEADLDSELLALASRIGAEKLASLRWGVLKE